MSHSGLLLNEGQVFEGKRDVILFAIDCSDSMHEMHDDPMYEDVQTSHVLTALEAAIQVQKKKVITGPNDAVGIMLFNTVRHTPCFSCFSRTCAHDAATGAKRRE